jgi:signal transduction histidine kinase
LRRIEAAEKIGHLREPDSRAELYCQPWLANDDNGCDLLDRISRWGQVLKDSGNRAVRSAEEWLTIAGGARTVRLAAGIVLAGTLLYVLLLPDPAGLRDHRLLGIALLIPVSLASLALLRFGKPLGAYLTLLCGTLLAITISALIVAGLRSALVFAYPAVIVGAMTLGMRAVLAFGLTAIVAVIGIGLADHHSLLPPPRLSPPFVLSLIYVLVLVALTAVVAAMVREQERWRANEQRAVSALETGMKALAERERDLRLVMNNVPAGICAFDGWVCRFANVHLAAYCGFGEQSIVGKHLREVLGDANYALAKPYVEQVLAGKPVNFRGPHPSPSFKGRHMMFSLMPQVSEPGGNKGFYGLFFDVTKQEQARIEIERLNRDLDRRVKERTADLSSANKELESFAYSISHDLRAPLRGIDGFSQMAIEEYGDKLDAQGRSYLERVRAAAQRMGSLIDDILELSRVSRQTLHRESVDLGRIATELLDEIRQTDAERRVEAAITPDCVTEGDPKLLRILMQNLLENAWKYSAQQAEARIEFGQERLATGETAYFVRDNGVGFDMQYADRLFTPFQRLHKPEEFAGSGIGLATVARIVHRHGGRVWVESVPGQGTTLRFTLGHGVTF